MLSLFLEHQTFSPEKGIINQKAFIAQSFVSNFLSGLMTRWAQVSQPFTDTTPTFRSLNQDNGVLSTPLASGNQRSYFRSNSVGFMGDKCGLVLGTSTVATSWNQSTVDSPIAHGRGSGELEYFGGHLGDVVIDGSDAYFDIERIFRNSSGGLINVKEFVLIGLQESYAILYARDAFASSGDWAIVANGEYLKVTYRLKITV